MGPLCHTWPFFPSSSRSMMLLSPPLLAVNCLSHSLPGGPGPHLSPPPGLTPFSSGSRQHPTPLSDTMLNYTVGKSGLWVKRLINKTVIWSTFNTKVYKCPGSYNQSCFRYGKVLGHDFLLFLFLLASGNNLWPFFFHRGFILSHLSQPNVALTFLPKK